MITPMCNDTYISFPLLQKVHTPHSQAWEYKWAY